LPAVPSPTTGRDEPAWRGVSCPTAQRHAHHHRLAHDRLSHVAYDPDTNQEGLRMRSLKLAALQKTLKAPPVFGKESGDLLVIGWGSTRRDRGIGDDAQRRGPQGIVDAPALPATPAARHQGGDAALQAGDDHREQLERRPAEEIIDESNRRYSALAMLLRARYLVDVDWLDRGARPAHQARHHVPRDPRKLNLKKRKVANS